VMLNLLTNAAKFVPQGRGQVAVRVRPDERGVEIEVHDNGPGVPEDLRATVFEKFRQGGDESIRRQGTGLGLPISRQIVEHFGGRMWLRNDGVPGACFCLWLPWTPADETPNQEPPTGDKHASQDPHRGR
jgi:signal transduction histidine kinase